MASILIVYSTTDGHTRKICGYLSDKITAAGNDVRVVHVDVARDREAGPDLEAFDKIVVGASIRYGKHSKAIREFVTERQAQLDAKPNAFFTVNVVARKPEKNTPETNPYIAKFLEQVPWQPRHLDVFAGVINYQLYGFLDRTMIRFIMWMTKGPTARDTNVEFTDWSRVDSFADLVQKM